MYLELNILRLATIFREVPSDIPVLLEYRGRLYNVTEYLNYKSIKLSKGLLKFSIIKKFRNKNIIAKSGFEPKLTAHEAIVLSSYTISLL